MHITLMKIYGCKVNFSRLKFLLLLYFFTLFYFTLFLLLFLLYFTGGNLNLRLSIVQFGDGSFSIFFSFVINQVSFCNLTTLSVC